MKEKSGETPTSRPRNSAMTTEAILRAAQRLFAAKGYTTTGVREIAAEAGVNSALVRRYFGSKEGLLRAAIEEYLHMDDILDSDRAGLGERVVAQLRLAETIDNPVSMMVLATADPAARMLCSDLVHERVILPLAEWLGPPDAMARAGQLNLLWMGFMTVREILPTKPVHEFEAQTFDWLAKATQAIVDQ